MGLFSKIILSLTIFTAVFTTAAPVLAQTDKYGLGKAAGKAELKLGLAGGDSVESVVGSIISVALSMIGIIFFLLILYAGFTWMIARGNTEAVDKSKSIIEGAVIGLIIVMAAYAITSFVFTSLDKGVAAQQPVTPATGPISCTAAGGTCVVSCTRLIFSVPTDCPAAAPQCCSSTGN